MRWPFFYRSVTPTTGDLREEISPVWGDRWNFLAQSELGIGRLLETGSHPIAQLNSAEGPALWAGPSFFYGSNRAGCSIPHQVGFVGEVGENLKSRMGPSDPGG